MTADAVRPMHHGSLGEFAARNLADVTKTAPQMGSVSPRWLLRMIPWVDVDAGMFRVNRVRVVGTEFEGVETRVEGETAALQPRNLRAIPLFRNLDDAMLESVAGNLQSTQIAAGEALMQEGQPGSELFILCAGKAEVFRTGPAGQKAVLSICGPGEFLGEVALLTAEPRNATVRAITPVLALKLSKAQFDQVLGQFPNMKAMIVAAAEERASDRRDAGIELTTSRGDDPMVSNTFVDYVDEPEEITLSSIMTTLRVHSRVMDLYKQPFDQLREQARLTIEAMKERQEWELLNNPEFGLANRVVPSMRRPTRSGPPTPDDMDDLIGRVWKEPAFFIMHPEAIAAFGRECTRRGVPPPTASLYGSSFLTWRGIPLVPSDKMEIDRTGSVPTTRILLMRVGEQRRGVIGLHQTSIGDERLPSFAIRYNGIDTMGVASYLVSLYFSATVLADDAIGSIDGVELGNYHSYER